MQILVGSYPYLPQINRVSPSSLEGTDGSSGAAKTPFTRQPAMPPLYAAACAAARRREAFSQTTNRGTAMKIAE